MGRRKSNSLEEINPSWVGICVSFLFCMIYIGSSSNYGEEENATDYLQIFNGSLAIAILILLIIATIPLRKRTEALDSRSPVKKGFFRKYREASRMRKEKKRRHNLLSNKLRYTIAFAIPVILVGKWELILPTLLIVSTACGSRYPQKWPIVGKLSRGIDKYCNDLIDGYDAELLFFFRMIAHYFYIIIITGFVSTGLLSLIYADSWLVLFEEKFYNLEILTLVIISLFSMFFALQMLSLATRANPIKVKIDNDLPLSFPFPISLISLIVRKKRNQNSSNKPMPQNTRLRPHSIQYPRTTMPRAQLPFVTMQPPLPVAVPMRPPPPMVQQLPPPPVMQQPLPVAVPMRPPPPIVQQLPPPPVMQQPLPVAVPMRPPPPIVQQLPPPPVMQPPHPPIPNSGLPPGWTVEQWHHYGSQWIEASKPR